jgi:hypothetical protein
VPAKFKTPFSYARDQLLRELELLGASDVVISSNMMIRQDGLMYAKQRIPDDRGVAVYFNLNGEPQCIPCDKWTQVQDNLQAIRLTVEALRGLERWGAKEMVAAAFKGFKALPSSIVTPPPADREKRPWWIVLGTTQDADAPTVKQAYRRAQATAHPDAGGSNYDFQEVQAAYDEWKAS